jgi:hypothetical protein
MVPYDIINADEKFDIYTSADKMPPVTYQFTYLALLQDILLGVAGIVLILIFHGISINTVLMRFERMTTANLAKKEYHWVFLHFYLSFCFIALIHIAEVLIWATFVYQAQLLNSGIDAILFAGSCYTTLGFIQDILPGGWKSLAFFISFSGIFSLAWTTSIMIGMTSTYRETWKLKNHHHKV